MNEPASLLLVLPESKRKIVEVLLKNPGSVLSFPWFKAELCSPSGMSERTLRRNLKALVRQGVLGTIELKNKGIFYGFPNVIANLGIRNVALQSTGARGNACISTRLPMLPVSPEEMIEDLRKAKEKPVIRPTGRSARLRKAQLKNYITGIDWQIDEMMQLIAKRDMVKRRQEIADKYSGTPGDQETT
jgi:hypothetical protein